MSKSSMKNTGGNGRVYMNSVKRIFSNKNPDKILAVAPSILSADFSRLGDELRKMLRARCYWTHLDVMDGHFVPNLTIGPPLVKSIRRVSSRLFFDTHLMLTDPLDFIEPFADAGTDILTFHAEAVDDVPAGIRKIRRAGMMAGISIRPKTPVTVIEPILDQIDMVLIMTVEPGFGGQSMITNTLNKVRQLARLRQERDLRFLIQVDGGINVKTAELAVCAGANILVAGSAVFGNGRVKENIDNLAGAALGRKA